MKPFLILLLSLLVISSYMHAEETNPSWDQIRERSIKTQFTNKDYPENSGLQIATRPVQNKHSTPLIALDIALCNGTSKPIEIARYDWEFHIIAADGKAPQSLQRDIPSITRPDDILSIAPGQEILLRTHVLTHELPQKGVQQVKLHVKTPTLTSPQREVKSKSITSPIFTISPEPSKHINSLTYQEQELVQRAFGGDEIASKKLIELPNRDAIISHLFNSEKTNPLDLSLLLIKQPKIGDVNMIQDLLVRRGPWGSKQTLTHTFYSLINKEHSAKEFPVLLSSLIHRRTDVLGENSQEAHLELAYYHLAQNRPEAAHKLATEVYNALEGIIEKRIMRYNAARIIAMSTALKEISVDQRPWFLDMEEYKNKEAGKALRELVQKHQTSESDGALIIAAQRIIRHSFKPDHGLIYSQLEFETFEVWRYHTVDYYQEITPSKEWDNDFIEHLTYAAKYAAGQDIPDEIIKKSQNVFNKFRKKNKNKPQRIFVDWADFIFAHSEGRGNRVNQKCNKFLQLHEKTQLPGLSILFLHPLRHLGWTWDFHPDLKVAQRARGIFEYFGLILGQNIQSGSFLNSPTAIQRALKLAGTCRMYENTQNYVDKALEFMDRSNQPDWQWRLINGIFHQNLAWSARGNGWANTVTEKGWEGFHKHLKEAVQEIESAWILKPNQIEIATTAFNLSHATETSETGEIWFQRLIDLCIDHPGAWRSMMIFRLPRWGGSYQALLEIGKKGADTERYETEAPWTFVSAIFTIFRDAKEASERAGNNIPLEQARNILKEAWIEDTLTTVLEGYEKHNPMNRFRCRSVLIGFLWQTNNKDKALELARALGEQNLYEGIDLRLTFKWKEVRDALKKE